MVEPDALPSPQPYWNQHKSWSWEWRPLGVCASWTPKCATEWLKMSATKGIKMYRVGSSSPVPASNRAALFWSATETCSSLTGPRWPHIICWHPPIGLCIVSTFSCSNGTVTQTGRQHVKLGSYCRAFLDCNVSLFFIWVCIYISVFPIFYTNINEIKHEMLTLVISIGLNYNVIINLNEAYRKSSF